MSNEQKQEKTRTNWIDVAKFIGIFAIYIGHFPYGSGFLHDFVFQFHVAFFFFLSGCTNYFDKEKSIKKYVVKKFKTILIPFFTFAVLSLCVKVLIDGMNISLIKESLFIIFYGCIRNEFFAYSLWFLSCLFIVEIIFKLIKCLKFKSIILIISLALFYIAKVYIQPPHVIYNIDSALYYLVFFALGYVLFPIINSLFLLNKRYKKHIFLFLLIISLIYTSLTAFNLNFIVDTLKNYNNIFIFYSIVHSLIIIMFCICLSKIFENFQIFYRLGQKSLYLCGNEYIVKESMICLLSCFGLSVGASNPLKVILYVIILFAIECIILIPFELKIKENLNSFFSNLLSFKKN